MDDLEGLSAIINQHRSLEGPLMPVLHAIQNRWGYIPRQYEKRVAESLNLSVAEVRGVISFYDDFRDTPPGRLIVRICCAEACQARGARALAAHAQASLGVGFGATADDDGITLEKVYCLGNCACGPSVSAGDEVFANVDAVRFDEIIAERHAGGEYGA